MDATNYPVLLLNKVPHQLNAVISNAGSGPMIEAKLVEINPMHGKDCLPHHSVELRHVRSDTVVKEPVFFKQDGKYTVLLGMGFVYQAQEKGAVTVRGRLLSTPMLKKCRVEIEPVQHAEESRPLDRGARTYHRDDSYQGNRPRLQPRRESEQSYFPEYDRQTRPS